jgi:hypothetical protein
MGKIGRAITMTHKTLTRRLLLLVVLLTLIAQAATLSARPPRRPRPRRDPQEDVAEDKPAETAVPEPVPLRDPGLLEKRRDCEEDLREAEIDYLKKVVRKQKRYLKRLDTCLSNAARKANFEEADRITTAMSRIEESIEKNKEKIARHEQGEPVGIVIPKPEFDHSGGDDEEEGDGEESPRGVSGKPGRRRGR